MIVDASALIAIIRREADADRFEAALSGGDAKSISAATWFETSIVADKTDGARGGEEFDELIQTFDVEIVPVTSDFAALARETYRRYGKGNHPAALNFGDCFAYALAKSTGRPLLFKGADFSKTDIIPVLR